MANLGKIVYLSAEQKDTLFANGSVTVGGTTITYSANDLYLTPETGASSVTSVDYDSTNKKITKTVGSSTSDVVSVSTLKTDLDLSKSDVGLGNVDNVRQYSASNPPPYPVTSVNGDTGAVTVTVPTKTSDLTNDSGFITGYTETDPTVPAWAKASSKPTYTASEVGALPASTVIPSKTSDLTNDSGFITGMTILSYGSSTWNDFLTAYNANKVVYCRASSNSNPATGNQTRMAFMAYVNANPPTNVEFQYYRSVNSHSATQQGDQVYVYKLDKSAGWTVTVRENYTKIVAGTGLSSSYSSGTLTLNNTATAPEAATATPIVSGTGAVGTSVKYAREDHVHPAQTTINGHTVASDVPANAVFTDTTYGTVSKQAAGLAPQLPDENTVTKFLRQDGTWAEPSGGSGVSAVTYDATNKKLTETINGTTSDIVSVATLKTDLQLAKGDVGLGNVENKSSAAIRGELTSSNVTTALGYTPPQQDTVVEIIRLI